MKERYLLFNLSQNIDVFCVMTSEEYRAGLAPYEIYWQDANTRRCFGPFATLFDAMGHFTRTTSLWRVATIKPNNPIKDNVIYVDFLNKKRLESL